MYKYNLSNVIEKQCIKEFQIAYPDLDFSSVTKLDAAMKLVNDHTGEQFVILMGNV